MNERQVVVAAISGICGLAFLSVMVPAVNTIVTALLICGFALGAAGVAAHLVQLNKVSEPRNRSGKR